MAERGAVGLPHTEKVTNEREMEGTHRQERCQPPERREFQESVWGHLGQEKKKQILKSVSPGEFSGGKGDLQIEGGERSPAIVRGSNCDLWKNDKMARVRRNAREPNQRMVESKKNPGHLHPKKSVRLAQ